MGYPETKARNIRPYVGRWMAAIKKYAKLIDASPAKKARIVKGPVPLLISARGMDLIPRVASKDTTVITKAQSLSRLLL
jgi:hypothetical protein